MGELLTMECWAPPDPERPRWGWRVATAGVLGIALLLIAAAIARGCAG